MDLTCFAGIVLALCAMIVIAFPDTLIPGVKERKRRVPLRHWGQYHGPRHTAPEDEGKEEPSVEVRTPARKVREIAGSQTYQAGRGVRMG